MIIDYVHVCITKIGTAQVSDTCMRDSLCHHQNTKVAPKNHKNGQKIIHFSNTFDNISSNQKPLKA